MSTPSPRRGNLVTVTFLLLLAILFEQYGIAPFFPLTNAAGSFRPMIVFLDIPLALPNIDWLPVSILFAIFYGVVAGTRLSHRDLRLGGSIWKALTGWWIFLACIAAGGGLYYLLQDDLPREVNKGIDSFGVRADLTLPWPSGELIHLHGSMFMLVFALLGGYIMARRTAIRITPGIPAAAEAPTAGSAAVAEAQAILNSPVPPVKPPVIKTPPAGTNVNQPASARAKEPANARTKEPARARVKEPVTTVVNVPVLTETETETEPEPEPEPPTCRLTTPPPVAMVMPRPAPGIGKVHPCIVIGSLKPTKR